MRILLTVDPEIPIPPVDYGGIERNLDYLQWGFSRAGHETVLLAHPDSVTPGLLCPWPGKSSGGWGNIAANTMHLLKCYHLHGPFDVILNLARLIYMLPLMGDSVPKIQSYHRFVHRPNVSWASALAGNSLSFVAISHFIRKGGQVGQERWNVIHNATPWETGVWNDEVPEDAPLVFVGRMDRVKGPHHAIDLAVAAERKIILAGNRAQAGVDAEYFEAEIVPRLKHPLVEYVGAVTSKQRDQLLARSSALLFPIDWDEPFGMVLIESMACGTPVIAINRGGVGEIIRHGVTGWLAHSVSGLAEGIQRIPTLNRKACRQDMKEHFSPDVAINAYLKLLTERASER